jgi:hypothetical protein
MRYVYKIIGAEVSATARCHDAVIQLNPLPHDDGLLFENIDCAHKSVATDLDRLPPASDDQCLAVVLNGNVNYSHDVQGVLEGLKPKLGRSSRVILVLYNPYYGWLYSFLSWLGLRRAPTPPTFLRQTDLRAVAELAGYEVVRLRPALYALISCLGLGTLINKLLPVVPLLRWTGFVAVAVLRPVVAETGQPSMTIVIPARNEEGNIEDALRRIPDMAPTRVEVIFVEGHSTDGTWEEIQRVLPLYESRFQLAAYRQSGRGKNDAVRTGFTHASYELLAILDADLTMPPEMLPRYYEAYCLGMGDFIHGNRLVYQMEGEAMRRLNHLGNVFFAKTLSYVLGIRLGDTLCGTKLFSKRDYARIVAWRDRFGDFDPFGDFEFLFAASEMALGIVDIPIRYAARTYGSTNIRRFRDGWRLLKMVGLGFLRVKLGKTK